MRRLIYASLAGAFFLVWAPPAESQLGAQCRGLTGQELVDCLRRRPGEQPQPQPQEQPQQAPQQQPTPQQQPAPQPRQQQPQSPAGVGQPRWTPPVRTQQQQQPQSTSPAPLQRPSPFTLPTPDNRTAGSTPMMIDREAAARRRERIFQQYRIATDRIRTSLSERHQVGMRCLRQDATFQSEAENLARLSVGAAAAGSSGLVAADFANMAIQAFEANNAFRSGDAWGGTLTVINMISSQSLDLLATRGTNSPIGPSYALNFAGAAATAYLNGFVSGCSGFVRSFDDAGGVSRALTVTNVDMTVEGSTNHVRRLDFTGTGLNELVEIRFSWSGPNNGQTVWRPDDRNWNVRFLAADNGRSAFVRPVVVAPNDPPGLYRWRVTLQSQRGETFSYNFDVDTRTNTNTTQNPAPPPTTDQPLATLAAPSNTSPGSSSSPGPTLNSTSVTLNWSAVNGAVEYDLGVREEGASGYEVDRRVRGTSVAVNLRPGVRYRWNVAACDARRCYDYSTRRYFVTPGGANTNNNNTNTQTQSNAVPAVPRNLRPGATSSPGAVVNDTRPTLNWDDVPGATRYEVGLRNVNSDVYIIDQYVTSSEIRAPALGRGQEFRWNVRACNAANQCSSFAPRHYFRVAN